MGFSHGQEMLGIPTSNAWSLNGQESLVLPYRRDREGLAVVETLMGPGKEGRRSLPLLSEMLLASS